MAYRGGYFALMLRMIHFAVNLDKERRRIMGDCGAEIQEIRFMLEPELTQVYVLVRAIGDCPIGVQGWHHKTFPVSKSVLDIMQNDLPKDYLVWAQNAP